MSIVVNTSSIAFYTDATLQSTVEISRPVTDCSGLRLELGDEDIATLGEVTFFPRALSEVEMEDLMQPL